jgi:hypothetical protein
VKHATLTAVSTNPQQEAPLLVSFFGLAAYNSEFAQELTCATVGTLESRSRLHL